MPLPPSPPQAYDINRLPHDPRLRLPIASYHVNDRDAIRRLYILGGPFKPISHQFSKRKIGDRDRSCSPLWLYKHNWVEYSIKKDSRQYVISYLYSEILGEFLLSFTELENELHRFVYENFDTAYPILKI